MYEYIEIIVIIYIYIYIIHICIYIYIYIYIYNSYMYVFVCVWEYWRFVTQKVITSPITNQDFHHKSYYQQLSFNENEFLR